MPSVLDHGTNLPFRCQNSYMHHLEERSVATFPSPVQRVLLELQKAVLFDYDPTVENDCAFTLSQVAPLTSLFP